MLMLKKYKRLQEAVRACTRTMSTATAPQTKYIEEDDELLFDSTDIVGTITINRPHVLNAFSISMIEQFQEKLEEYENTKQFVVVRGAEDCRAFCAGADIQYVTSREPSQNKRGKAYFRAGYTTINYIGTYKIPYVALINGITIGGGVGLSVPGKYRIATENTVFAMPETKIGFYPDVGGSYFLPRLTGKLGLYLGLTGHMLKGADVVKAGIATHFIESANISRLYNELTNGSTTADNLDAVIAKHTIPTHDHKFSLSPVMSKINRCLSEITVEDIIEELRKDNSDWANKTVQILKSRSPIGLKMTKRAYDLGSKMNLQDCLKMENRMSAAVVEARVSKDLYEGVRALLIDKDNNPKWNPKTLEEISEETVAKCFEPLADKDEEITYLRSRDSIKSNL